MTLQNLLPIFYEHNVYNVYLLLQALVQYWLDRHLPLLHCIVQYRSAYGYRALNIGVALHTVIDCPVPELIGINPTTPPCCRTGWLS